MAQDKPRVGGVSFDRGAANAFQQYCQAALAFSIKRGGICYGTGEGAWRTRADTLPHARTNSAGNDLRYQCVKT